MTQNSLSRKYILDRNTVYKKKARTARKTLKIKYGDFKKLELSYSDMEPMHNLWKSYMYEIAEDNYMKADFHGAVLLVSWSKCATLRGVYGIVVVESRNTFLMITKDDRLLTVPKRGSRFQFVLRGRLHVLIGDAICMTPAGRLQKKMKSPIPLPDFRDRLIES